MKTKNRQISFDSFVDGMRAHCKAIRNPRTTTSDLEQLSILVAESVEEFLVTNDIARASGSSWNPNTAVSLESLGPELNSSDHTSIDALLDRAEISENRRAMAAEEILHILYKHMNVEGGSQGTLRTHMIRADHANQTISYESIYTDAVAGYIGDDTVSLESFGVNINTSVADLKMALIIGLMKYHNGVMTRVLPVIKTDEPTVTMKISRFETFDLADASATGTPLIDIVKDPSSVSNKLKPLEILKANEENGEVPANGILAFNKPANVRELALASGDVINHSDIIADSAQIKTLYVTLSKAGVAGSDRTFALTVPIDMNRMTRKPQSEDAAIRVCDIRHNFYIGKTDVATNGSVSPHLSAIEPDERIKVRVNVHAELNLRTGEFEAIGHLDVSAYVMTVGATAEAALTAAIVNLDNCSFYGLALDARWNEENMRRSSIMLREHVATLSYNLPIGRNYMIEPALTQDVSEAYMNALSSAVEMGEDDKIYDLMMDNLTNVAAQVAAAAANLDNKRVARNYAAGWRCNPFVKVYELDFGLLHSHTDSEKPADIKQRLVSFITAVAAELQAESLVRRQVAQGKKVNYRCITTGIILDCVLAQKHSVSALDVGVSGNSGEVAYRLPLTDDVNCEFVVSDQNKAKDQITMVLYFTDSPTSDLNVGAIYDMGAVSGNVHMTDSGVRNRVYANSRRFYVPKNPVAAIITVKGALDANKVHGIQYAQTVSGSTGESA